MENQTDQNQTSEVSKKPMNQDAINAEELSSQASSDDSEQAGSVYGLEEGSDAETQVRATEDASLQDDTYAFDEDNTSNEDIHDVSDFGDVDSGLFDSQEDYI